MLQFCKRNAWISFPFSILFFSSVPRFIRFCIVSEEIDKHSFQLVRLCAVYTLCINDIAKIELCTRFSWKWIITYYECFQSLTSETNRLSLLGGWWPGSRVWDSSSSKSKKKLQLTKLNGISVYYMKTSRCFFSLVRYTLVNVIMMSCWKLQMTKKHAHILQ